MGVHGWNPWRWKQSISLRFNAAKEGHKPLKMQSEASVNINKKLIKNGVE